jgi:uncharacterized protein (TIGR02217 family)
MPSFHEVQFPLRLALGTSGGPWRRTDIVALSNGRESRNQRWKDARRRYDAGSGVRSVSDLYEVVAFFEARAGQLHGFRFGDPVDFQSCGPEEIPAVGDQLLGIGDGSRNQFQLVKHYADAGGSTERVIAKPQAGSVVVSVAGAAIDASAFGIDLTTGVVTLDTPPANGAEVRAGFRFDVPVRFDTDRIEVDLDAFRAGRIPSIPLIEVMP